MVVYWRVFEYQEVCQSRLNFDELRLWQFININLYFRLQALAQILQYHKEFHSDSIIISSQHRTFKSKRFNIMVWDCFQWDRLGFLIICESGEVGTVEYLEILDDGLLFYVCWIQVRALKSHTCTPRLKLHTMNLIYRRKNNNNYDHCHSQCSYQSHIPIASEQCVDMFHCPWIILLQLETNFNNVDKILVFEDDDIIRVRVVDDFIFMQDDTSCHRSAKVAEFLTEKEINVMMWSVQIALSQSHREYLINAQS